VLSDIEPGSSSSKPVVLSSSDSESCVDESGLGLESRYVCVASRGCLVVEGVLRVVPFEA